MRRILRKSKKRIRLRAKSGFSRLEKWRVWPGKIIKRTGVVLLLLILGVAVLEIWREAVDSIWDGKHQLTIVFESSEQIGYVRVNPSLNEVKLFVFPDKTQVNLAMGFGDYQADKLVRLSKQEELELGPFLQKSMTQFLGSLTDAYIVEARVNEIKIQKLLWQALLKRAKTNLSNWDVLQLIVYVSNLNKGDIRSIEIDKNSILTRERLADQSEVLLVNQDRLDAFALTELANPIFLDSSLTWEVVNTTNHDGLGKLIGRIVANSGFNLIGVRQGKSLRQTSYIKVNAVDSLNLALNKESVQTFADYFKFEVILTDVRSLATDINSGADVTIVVSQDFWKDCCWR